MRDKSISDFCFYHTVDADSVRSFMPEMPVMLPASSFARRGLHRNPNLPAHITERAADCGGFVATLKWGDYRYTPTQYVRWLRMWEPSWAATFDYCCEPEVLGRNSVLARQMRTTVMAWYFAKQWADVPWAWVPTVQGWTVADYRRGARLLRPLVVRLMRREHSMFRVGIGTLCRRASTGMIQDVVATVRDELPGVGLHLWGVKLGLLQSAAGLPPSVVSVDSAAGNGLTHASGRTLFHQSGRSQRRYTYEIALPEYREKVQRALSKPRTMPMF